MALANSESLVAQWLPGGRRSGPEWVCGGINGEPGRRFSVNLTTGVWMNFATGKGCGDLVSLLAHIRGCSQSEAAAEIDPSLARSLNGNSHPNGNGRRPAPASAPRAARKPAPEWVPLPCAPDNAPEPSFRHYIHGEPVMVSRYATRDGRTAGFVCRYDTTDGKRFSPFSWCRGPGGALAWKPQGFAEPRPLYGLETLTDEGPVYITEGEKSADALRRLLPGEIVMTWPNGSGAVAKADWAPLAGRDVIVWPDNDEPGAKAVRAILKHLPQARIVDTGGDRPEGWDAADAEAEGWTADDARALLANLLPVAVAEQDPDRAPAADRHLPFRMLGKADGKYYYQPHKGMEIVGLSPSAHVKLNLMDLAALQDWEAEFPNKSGVDWDSAVNAMLQRSSVLPKFDPRRVRGRGCWIDGEDVVFHAGSHLTVNGVEQDIRAYQSPIRAVYEGALEIQTHDGPAASNAEGIRLLELCGMLPWERPLSGILLAGWLALAPICGALGWRPHVWLTGPSGSGKSWVVSNIITPMVGKTCLAVQGASTEAGIRGTLRSDALPVIFDEAESENAAGMGRLDKVLELARQASSEGGAAIIKGTADGRSVSYLVRSMFLFASIGTAATKKADTSRISVLELRKSKDQESFGRIKALWAETVMQPAYTAAIRARLLAHAMTIRKNAEVFSGVAVEILGDKRSADQIGALLAGYHSLKSTQPVTLEAARDFMSRQDWGEHRPDEVDSDESRCFSHLMDSLLTLEHGAKVPVGEKVAEAEKGDLDAQATLKRWGMKVQEGRLWVANRHTLLGDLFRDTPWAAEKWSQQFARMPGAQKMPASKFGPKCTQRSVSICLEEHD
ncbi:MAG: hypothetical protein JWM59_727 [Verrucomicrobiales bacterium]|nr:hypothetical protein [Verrucomicrobiales bacterium]